MSRIAVAGAALVPAALTVAGVSVVPGPAGSAALPVPAAYMRVDVTTSPSAPASGDDQPPINSADKAIYGPYFIYNYATKLCADLPGSGAAADDAFMDQDTCVKTGTDNQEFAFLPHGTDSKGNQQYWIKNTASGYCLDVPGLSTVASGTAVQQNDCLDNDNQYFRLEPRFAAGGFQYYWLHNTVADDMCLDVLGVGDTKPTLGLAIVPCLANDDHEWALVEKSQWATFGSASVGEAPASSSNIKIIVWVLVGIGAIIIIGLATFLGVRLRQNREEARRAKAADSIKDQFWQPPVGGWQPPTGGQAQGNEKPTMFP
jgi:hypothetical protein